MIFLLIVVVIYVNVFVGHVGEGFSEVLQEDTEKSGGGDQDKGFFVQDIDLLGDQEGRDTGESSNITSLGNNRVTGKRVNETVGLLLGFLYSLQR